MDIAIVKWKWAIFLIDWEVSRFRTLGEAKLSSITFVN